MPQLYKLPLSFNMLTSRQKHPVCPEGESVAQHIHLILLSRFGEYHFDYTYGCIVWDQDFTLTANTVAWKEKMRKSIVQTLLTHEKRVSGLTVEVEIAEEEFLYSPDTSIRKVKKRIGVAISGVLKATNEDFSFKEDIFISPISLD